MQYDKVSFTSIMILKHDTRHMEPNAGLDVLES